MRGQQTIIQNGFTSNEDKSIHSCIVKFIITKENYDAWHSVATL